MSLESEKYVWKLILTKAEFYLKNFPTTFEEDVKMLEDDMKFNNLTINNKNCISLRAGCKKVYK